jgi:hypothetical protein
MSLCNVLLTIMRMRVILIRMMKHNTFQPAPLQAASQSLEPVFSRQITHISRVERKVIWVLRRSLSSDSASMRSVAAQVVPAEHAERLALLAGQLHAIVSQSALAGAMVNAPDELNVSEHEDDLLALLAFAQQGGELSRAVGRMGWIAFGDDLVAQTTLNRMAQLLLRAGHQLPDPRPLKLLDCRPVFDRTALDAREQVLLDAVRIWSDCFIQRVSGLPAVLELFKRAQLRTAGVSLNAVMLNTVMTSTRALDVRCRLCRSISVDEGRMLHAISLSQRGYVDACEEVLKSWLPAAAARLTAPAVAGIGNAVGDAGYRLALRDWRFPELVGSSSWTDVNEKAGNYVH